jgi:hypothetical protein
MNRQAQSFTTWRERDGAGAGDDSKEPILSVAQDEGVGGGPPGSKHSGAAPATLLDAARALLDV